MRNVAIGFACGYFLIAFLIIPPVLYGLNYAPDYGAGVVIVLDRTGVLAPIRSYAAEVAHFRQQKVNQLNEYIATNLVSKLLIAHPQLTPGMPDKF